MSLLSMLTEGTQLSAEYSGTPAPWDDFWYGPVGAASSTGMRVTPDTAKRVAAVLACVSKIGKSLAMFPTRIYRELANGSKQLATNHPLYDVIYQRPNHFQTAYEFKQMMQGHLELRGNAYAEIQSGNRRAVDQLIPLHPDRIIVEQLKPSGRLRYQYSDPLLNGEPRAIAQEEMFHLRNWSDDGATGQSTITMGIDVFGLALAAQDYYARFVKNDAKPSVYITGAPAFKTVQDQKDWINNWQANQTGPNRGKVAVLRAGMDVKSLGVTAKDFELLEARKFSRIEICSIFDVPPHLIGEIEKTASYASVEQFNIMFAVFCLLPRIVNWEQTIQRDLIFDDSYFAKFSIGALLRGDNASRATFYKNMIEMGVFSQNDVRILEDMNPIEDGDTYWRPLNWAPLGQITNPTPNQVPASTTGDTGPEVQPTEDDTETGTALNKLRLMSSIAATPSVLREVNAIRKLHERSASEEIFREGLRGFYRENIAHLRDKLKLPEAMAANYCDEHYDFLATANGNFEERLAAISRYAPRVLGAQLTKVIE